MSLYGGCLDRHACQAGWQSWSAQPGSSGTALTRGVGSGSLHMSREVGLPAVLAYQRRQLPTRVGGSRRVRPKRLVGPSLHESGPSEVPGLHPRHLFFPSSPPQFPIFLSLYAQLMQYFIWWCVVVQHIVLGVVWFVAEPTTHDVGSPHSVVQETAATHVARFCTGKPVMATVAASIKVQTKQASTEVWRAIMWRGGC